MREGEANLRIGLIGYGEVGRILTQALREKGIAWVGAWDILFRDAAQGPSLKARAREGGIEACGSLAELLAGADVAISAVTASNALDVAREAAASIRQGTYFLDLNSASPATKAASAKLVDAVGAHYVEAGVMTSVPPRGIRTPMLLGGREARSLAAKLAPLGFDMTVVADEIGVASAIKMCRSVIIKGIEALVIESYATARRHGVERHVIESLRETFPSIDWEKQGAYLFSRVAKHGRRRAEEMREVANTVREAGFEPWLSAAIAEKQDWVAALASSGLFRDLEAEVDWRDYADRMIAAAEPARGKKSA
jgi:3-hydroxyisobutyrate dehydrogenase-like beta-hydroxyacid dehydrogenase